ncbi:MAG TPA: ABC transporter permease [Candidatus Acidoferrales bacterium]|nr:ABC transporter permease [Candidatus Acidoferrales bacterium]
MDNLAVADFCEGIGRADLWWALAWKDIRNRYRRTILGPFWAVLNAALMVASIGFVYSLIWHENLRTYIPFFCAGYVSWLMFSAIVNESCSVLINESATLKMIRVQYSVFLFRMIARNLMVAAHSLAVFVPACLVFGIIPGWPLAMLPLGILLATANYLWIGALLAVVCARFRDVIQLVVNATQVLFFVTPIFWSPAHLAGNRLAETVFVTINPAYLLVEVIRAPLLGRAPEIGVYVPLILMAVAGFAVAGTLLSLVYKRIPYWL